MEALVKSDNALSFQSMEIFDQLSNYISCNEALSKDLTSYLTTNLNTLLETPEPKQPIPVSYSWSLVDHFWNFWLKDTSEFFLPRPDDYDYSRNFSHGPLWLPLLCCKMGVRPIPLDGADRASVPIKVPEKRRFEAGFLICVLPTCGFPDSTMRRYFI